MASETKVYKSRQLEHGFPSGSCSSTINSCSPLSASAGCSTAEASATVPAQNYNDFSYYVCSKMSVLTWRVQVQPTSCTGSADSLSCCDVYVAHVDMLQNTTNSSAPRL